MTEYRIEDGIAHVEFDSGKVNALGSGSITDLEAQLDRANRDQASAVVISGREGIFSAGFDLEELRSGDGAREQLRRQLVDLVLRIFCFDRPVVVACTGHALAAGAALLLAADRRIGLDGPYKLGFNEASLGVTISAATVALARYRMPMPWFESLITGETYPPVAAQRAGLLDEVVDDVAKLAQSTQAEAERLGGVPRSAFLEMRRLARGPVVDVIRLEHSRLTGS